MRLLPTYQCTAVLCLTSCIAGAVQAQDLNALWRVRVMDMDHEIKAEATIRFTDEAATESCIGGTWKRAVVVSTKIPAKDNFFPLKDLLAYEIRDGELTLGRTQVCDGYQFLTGTVNRKHIDGAYNTVGLGYHKQIGYFSLEETK